MLGFKKTVTYTPTDLIINNSAEGERIETKVARIMQMNEPITDGAPIIETPEEEGVIPLYDVRADAWEIALDELTQVHINGANDYAKKIAEINKNVQGGGTETGDKKEDSGGE